MTRLSLVELRRFAARAAIRWLAVGMLAVVAMTMFAAYRATVPPSQAALDQAQAFYEEQLDYWEESGQADLERCEQDEAAEQERNPGIEIDFGCESMKPVLENFLPYRTTFADSAADWLGQAATPLLMLAVVAGATFVAAEFSTGSISTWLTFEPRRGRVFASKAVVVALATGVLALAASAVALAGVWGVGALNGALGEPTGELWRGLAGQAGRIGAAGAVAALLGAALAFLLRHTAAAIAVVVGWFIAFEGILSSLVVSLQQWTLRINLTAWLNDGTTYQTADCAPDATGVYTCVYADHTIGVWQGGGVLLAYAAVATLAALLVFRRRDVG